VSKNGLVVAPIPMSMVATEAPVGTVEKQKRKRAAMVLEHEEHKKKRVRTNYH
jgi:hypothetical protein